MIYRGFVHARWCRISSINSINRIRSWTRRFCTNKAERNCLYGGFLKWWYPTTMGFPTKNDHFGVFWGYHHLKETPIWLKIFPFWASTSCPLHQLIGSDWLKGGDFQPIFETLCRWCQIDHRKFPETDQGKNIQSIFASCVVSTHLKSISQNRRSFPQMGLKMKRYLSFHHLSLTFHYVL